MLIAVILSDSTTNCNCPLNACVCLRSQWKFAPMVTSCSENEASSVCGRNVSSRYWLPRHSIPPSENSTFCSPSSVSPLAVYGALSVNEIFCPLNMPTFTNGSSLYSMRRRGAALCFFMHSTTFSILASPSATSRNIASALSEVRRSKSSCLGVIISPAMSRAPGLTRYCASPSAL